MSRSPCSSSWAQCSSPGRGCPGGEVASVRASEVFSAEQLRRGEAYSSAQRHLGWASLAVSLGVAAPPRPDPAGRAADPAPARPVVGARAARHAGGAGARRAGDRAVRPGDAQQRARLRAHPAVAGRLAAGPGGVPAGLLGVRRRDGAAGARHRPPLPAAVAAVGGPGGRAAHGAGVLGLPAGGRAAVQPVHAAAARRAAHQHHRAGGRRSTSRSPTCWWPTRPGVRRP